MIFSSVISFVRQAKAARMPLCICGSLALLAGPAVAATDTPLPALHPAPGVYASLSRDAHGGYILHQPDGRLMRLALPVGNPNAGPPIFTTGDFNFDGHQDFSISIAVGMVNANTYLYLYLPAKRAYRRLEVPKDVVDRMTCKGLGDLADLEPKPGEKTLYSNCRSGPLWYYDALRFDAGDRLWLYKQLQGPFSPLSYPNLSFELIEVTFDQQGKIVAKRPTGTDGSPVPWTVPRDRVDLYAAPDATSRTKAYLIAGNKTEMIGIKGRWLRIRYQSRKGPLDRWVSLDKVYGPESGG
jgi:hypothetical protein